MMQILVVGILPRGAWSLPNPFAWPNRLTEGIELVNNASKVVAFQRSPPDVLSVMRLQVQSST